MTVNITQNNTFWKLRNSWCRVPLLTLSSATQIQQNELGLNFFYANSHVFMLMFHEMP